MMFCQVADVLRVVRWRRFTASWPSPSGPLPSPRTRFVFRSSRRFLLADVSPFAVRLGVLLEGQEDVPHDHGDSPRILQDLLDRRRLGPDLAHQRSSKRIRDAVHRPAPRQRASLSTFFPRSGLTRSNQGLGRTTGPVRQHGGPEPQGRRHRPSQGRHSRLVWYVVLIPLVRLSLTLKSRLRRRQEQQLGLGDHGYQALRPRRRVRHAYRSQQGRTTGDGRLSHDARDGPHRRPPRRSVRPFFSSSRTSLTFSAEARACAGASRTRGETRRAIMGSCS